MEPIELTRFTPNLDDQLSFLIKREMYVRYHNYRKMVYVVGISLLLVIVLLFLPDTKSIIELKVISIVIFSMLLLFSAILLFGFLVTRQKRNNWKRKAVQGFSPESNLFKFCFDEEKLLFETGSYKSEIKWDYYKYWAENKDSLFIFPERSIYEAIYYSKTELGIDNYDNLKRIVGSKLISLPGMKLF